VVEVDKLIRFHHTEGSFRTHERIHIISASRIAALFRLDALSVAYPELKLGL
jgi:hypothetical protein